LITPLVASFTLRHDAPKKLFAVCAKEVFNDVEVEPQLVPLSGEKMDKKSANVQGNARSDVRVRGLWGTMRNAFLDFRVVHPFAKCYRDQKPSSLLRSAEKSKRREYGQRVVEVEDADFTPMVLSSVGGMGKEMEMAIKHLARCIAEKRKTHYPPVVALLRRKFCVTMLRSALVCLRGSRSLYSARVEGLGEMDVASHRLRL
jgi:hypothetical protein